MPGKLTTILAKKEAELYCAQGLHREALNLYRQLLISSPNMDPTLKSAIESQVADIVLHLRDQDTDDEHTRLTASDILMLKNGWGARATPGDLMVCAQSFYRLGHFRSALAELGKLMERGSAHEAVVGLFADCLAGIGQPQRLIAVVERIIQKAIAGKGHRLAFLLLLTETLILKKQSILARVLHSHLQAHPVVRSKAPKRLRAIAKALAKLEKTATPPPPS